MKIRNHANYLEQGNPSGENFTLPSQTIPGMVPTLRELLEKYVRGENVTQFNPIYDDNPLIPDNFERLDFAEREAYLADIKEVVRETRSRLGRSKPEKTDEADPQPVEKFEEGS